jgi:DNA repair protein RecO (recombination protein O)
MDETYSAQAIILQREPFRENDSRIIAYSLEHGKLELIARGTNKILSKLAGHIEPVSLSEIMVVKGRRYDYAGSAIARNNYILLKRDLAKLTSVGIVFKAFNKTVGPGVADDRLFRLLLDYLDFLNQPQKDRNYDLSAYYFILKLLSDLGYRPALYNCAVCNRKLRPEINYFSAGSGGIVCAKCCKKEPTALLTISDNAIKILRLANEKKFVDLMKIKTDKNLENEIIKIISTFYQYQYN